MNIEEVMARRSELLERKERIENQLEKLNNVHPSMQYDRYVMENKVLYQRQLDEVNYNLSQIEEIADYNEDEFIQEVEDTNYVEETKPIDSNIVYLDNLQEENELQKTEENIVVLPLEEEKSETITIPLEEDKEEELEIKPVQKHEIDEPKEITSSKKWSTAKKRTLAIIGLGVVTASVVVAVNAIMPAYAAATMLDNSREWFNVGKEMQQQLHQMNGELIYYLGQDVKQAVFNGGNGVWYIDGSNFANYSKKLIDNAMNIVPSCTIFTGMGLATFIKNSELVNKVKNKVVKMKKPSLPKLPNIPKPKLPNIEIGKKIPSPLLANKVKNLTGTEEKKSIKFSIPKLKIEKIKKNIKKNEKVLDYKDKIKNLAKQYEENSNILNNNSLEEITSLKETIEKDLDINKIQNTTLMVLVNNLYNKTKRKIKKNNKVNKIEKEPIVKNEKIAEVEEKIVIENNLEVKQSPIIENKEFEYEFEDYDAEEVKVKENTLLSQYQNKLKEFSNLIKNNNNLNSTNGIILQRWLIRANQQIDLDNKLNSQEKINLKLNIKNIENQLNRIIQNDQNIQVKGVAR